MIAIGLSMDAFAVSTTNGMCVSKQYKQHNFFTRALVWSAMFGLFQGLMPMLGYFLARSHMCVRNATSHSKFIFDWAPVNETIIFVLE